MSARSLLSAAAALGAAAALAPAVAGASTVAYEGPGATGAVVFRAEPGRVNSMGVQEGGVAGSVTFSVSAGDPISALPAECEDHRDYGAVTCAAPGGVRLELGDGDDWATVSLGVGVPVAMLGGPGDDRLEGNAQPNALSGEGGDDILYGSGGDDVLDGGDGNDQLDGYGGADRLLGGAGDDLLQPDHYEEASPDVVDGGSGTDTIESEWSTRLIGDVEPPVALTLGGGADDGRPGEGDDVRGVERLILSKGGTVVGTDAAEYVKLHQVAEAGDLTGLGGDDELRGGDGGDRLDGGVGNDVLDGGFGDDVIVGGPGRDRISADLAGGDCGPYWCKLPFGNDVVEARDGEVDSVSCGVGADRVVADAEDVVAPDCEVVERAVVAAAPPGAGPAAPGPPAGPAGRPAVGGSAGSGAGAGSGSGSGPVPVTLAAVKGQRLRTALRRGLTVRVTGGTRGARVSVRLTFRGRTVASGKGLVGHRVVVRFTARGKRALGGRAKARLGIVAAGATAGVTLRR